jgi:hypothetical protein
MPDKDGPRRVIALRAAELYGRPVGYLLRERGEAGDAWKQVAEPVYASMPVHDGRQFPSTASVKFTDGTERIFNADDHIEIMQPAAGGN